MTKPPDSPTRRDFESAGVEPRISLIRELYLFIKENKRWVLIPIFLSLGLVGLLVALNTSAAGPFIYTLF